MTMVQTLDGLYYGYIVDDVSAEAAEQSAQHL